MLQKTLIKLIKYTLVLINEMRSGDYFAELVQYLCSFVLHLPSLFYIYVGYFSLKV
jgi:hypothetical protein